MSDDKKSQNDAKLFAALRIAKGLKGSKPSARMASRLNKIADFFTRSTNNVSWAPLNVVLFHLNIPSEISTISTFDIDGLDHGAFEYDKIVKLNLDLITWLHPAANVYLITDLEFLKDYENPRVRVLRANFDPSHVMFERVVAMAAFVSSKLFNAPTVFVDSDAYLISSPCKLFDEAFDVGVTHRHNSGLMPVNEGVIYANNSSVDRAINFFTNYVGIYDQLLGNAAIAEIYTNVGRWRGGQLSINGACQGSLNYGTSVLTDRDGVNIAYLPCAIYNNTPTVIDHDSLSYLFDRSIVLHFKGPKKFWINQFETLLYSKGFPSAKFQ